MPLVLYCRHCQHGYRHTIGVLPDACPLCGLVADWSAVTVEHDPRVPFHLSVNDRRFLRGIKIQVNDHAD